MVYRRNFIKTSAALAAGTMLIPSTDLINVKKKRKFGVQLYTANSVINDDLKGVLKGLADIGYKDLESAGSPKGGYYGLTAMEFSKLAKEYGLTWVAHHATGFPFRMPAGAPPPAAPAAGTAPAAPRPPARSLKTHMQELVDEAAQGGLKYLVCSSSPVKTMEEVNATLEVLQKTGEACKKAGIKFAFHNHTAEFEAVEGKRPFDLMASQISADILKFELDIAWATKAGVNIPELFKTHPGRFPLWHVKDLNSEQKPVEIGQGYIKFDPIFKEAKLAGAEYFFVEQDGAPKPIENLNNSYKNLVKVSS